MMHVMKLAAIALALAAPAAANAAKMFQLTYTTSVDATSGPAVTVDATITTDDGSGFGDNGFFVTGLTGTRGSEALVFYDNFDEIFYPSNTSGNIVDDFGLSFFAGGTLYQFYKSPGDFAYHEYDGATGRLVFNDTVSLVPIVAVPEPAMWAMMIGGMSLIGASLRRRPSTNIRFA